MSTRIATTQLYQTAQSNVASAREKEIVSSEKAATNKEINRPSQNPTGWVQAANLKDDLSQRDTIAKNATLANRVLSMSENVLSQVQEFVQRTHEITIPAASDSVGTYESRTAILAEAKTLYDSVLRTLNTRYAGRTLFGGFQSKGAAFNHNGEYVGDDGQFQIEIGKGLVVPINVDSRQIISGSGSREGVNLIDAYKTLITGLEENNTEAIRASLPMFLKSIEQLSVGRSQIGARQGEIDRALNNHSLEKIDALETISQIEEVDAVKAFSDLQRDQTILRAAMSTTQKILTEDPTTILFK